MNSFLRLIVSVWLAFVLLPVKGQQVSKTAFRFQPLPVLAGTAAEAWKQYYPKGVAGPFARESMELQKEAEQLADLSDHKSYFLALVAKRYENDPKRTLASISNLKKDKSLEMLMRELNIEVFGRWDDYTRHIGNAFDSLTQNGLKGNELANAWLLVFRREIEGLKNDLQRSLYRLQAYLNQKGYNKVVDQADKGHPFFVQLLEARGFILDQHIKLFQVMDNANRQAADMVDACQKNPEACR